MKLKKLNIKITEWQGSDEIPDILLGKFCDECKELGYCKKYGPLTNHINDKSPYNLQSHRKKPETKRVNSRVMQKVK